MKRSFTWLAVVALVGCGTPDTDGATGGPATGGETTAADTTGGETATADTTGADTTGADAADPTWIQPEGSVALSFFADDTANRSYDDGNIRWTGSFAWDKETNTAVHAASWLPDEREWPLLYDDGPISAGGHEADGQNADDGIFSTEVYLTAEDETLIEYGALNEFGRWIWIGPNGLIAVAAGQTERIDAAGVTFPKFGSKDLKLTIDLGALHDEFSTITAEDYSVYVKGTMNSWTPVQILDNGETGDDAEGDGVYTYLHSSVLGPHDGLVAGGQHVQFVFVFALTGFEPDDGLEYKFPVDALPDGVKAYTGPAGEELAEEAVIVEPDSYGKVKNTTVVVSGKEPDPPKPDCDAETPCEGDLVCVSGQCKAVGDPPDKPYVSLVDPGKGGAAGGDKVTVSGGGFKEGAKVLFGGAEASGVTILSHATLECITPPGSMGAVDVVVDNPDGGSGSYPGGFTYTDKAAPIISAVQPASGSLDGGTVVTITGSNFQPNAVVGFGVGTATDVQLLGGNIICTTPAGAEKGSVDVTVTNPDQQKTTQLSAFEYVPGLVNWATLEAPLNVTVGAGQGATVLSRVYHPNVTPGDGAGSGLLAELGYGATGSAPGDDWSWSGAIYKGDQGNDDSFKGDLPSDLPQGTYAWTFRFSLDGEQWLYADGDGTGNGYQMAQAGSLTVAAGGVPIMDGVIGADWPDGSMKATDSDNPWASSDLEALYLHSDGTWLYIGIKGQAEAMNAFACYIDTNYGDGSGQTPATLSDTDGALDNVLSSAPITVADSKFGAEYAVGAYGGVAVAGELVGNAGLRDLTNPADFSWLAADVAWGADGMEARIPLDTLGVGAGDTLGIFVRLVSGDGATVAPEGLPSDGAADSTVNSVVTLDVP